MGKTTGFMEWDRHTAPKRPVPERLRDHRELVGFLSEDERRHQAGRCMDCGVPFCHQGCPLGNPIPDFNQHAYADRWREAFEVLSVTNDFPELTGRLCPAPCEGACVLAIDGPAVTIEQLEKEIIERAFSEGWVQAKPPLQRTGRTVAVVGSGPAGLAAASRLNRSGHQVTVFERAEAVGGLLRFGIPDFKLEKWVLERRLELLAAEGIVFKTSIDVGREPSWSTLKAQFDAVVIATGAMRPRALEVPGVELQGVWQAMPFLELQNRHGPPVAKDKHVVILGGGDTGSDCLGTALRQGAASVTQVELLPAPPDQRAPNNPWPQWPLVFRTSSSQEEGGERRFGRRTVALEGENGVLTAIRWVDVNDATKEERQPVQLLIQAMGFVGPETQSLIDQLGLQLEARGTIRTDAAFATSAPGVFAAGDCKRGASLIVWAIAEGRDLAKSVDRYLRAG